MKKKDGLRLSGEGMGRRQRHGIWKPRGGGELGVGVNSSVFSFSFFLRGGVNSSVLLRCDMHGIIGLEWLRPNMLLVTDQASLN
jgi:hypothetical protein